MRGQTQIRYPRTQITIFCLLFLAFSGLIPSSTQAVSIEKLQPLLRQLAVDEPDLPVEVIVQKSGSSSSIEDTIRQWGGEITKDLHIINSIVTRLPAKLMPKLAALPSVQWVSVNGQMYKSSLLDAEGGVLLREEFNDSSLQDGQWSGLGTWTGQPWQEIGEHDGPASGDVAVTNFFGGEFTGLRLQNGNKGLIGYSNLGDVSQAVLSYSYRQKDLDDANDFVTVEASTDGGSTWFMLRQYAGPATDTTIQFASIDISAYVSESTAIRFVTSPGFDATDKFYVDFVQLEFVAQAEAEKSAQSANNQLYLPIISSNGNNSAAQVASSQTHPIPAKYMKPEQVGAAATSNVRTVCDIFSTGSYSGNCGWENWSGSWIESEVSSGGSGPTSGHVQIANENLRLDNYPSTGGKPSAARKANLSNGVVAAVLAFGVFTSAGVDPSDTAVVEVSKDGGANYTVLETFTGVTGEAYLAREIDVTRFASANFMVRFRIQSNYSSANEYFNVDYVTISYERIDSGAAWAILTSGYSYGWKYSNSGANLGTTWRNASYNDSTWPVGTSEMGYGDVDEATVLSYGNDPNNKPITVYFRRSFEVTDAAQFTSLNVHLLADDGAIVYLNGTEVVRQNMPGGTVSYTTRASTDVGGTAETTFYDYAANPALLVNGENVIAVEVHQYAPNSPDLSFNLELGGWNECVDCVNTAVVNSTHLKSIRATDLWNGTARLQGQGVAVAVLDSGITPHFDNNNALMRQRILTQVNFSSSPLTGDDANGHGSHIAGIIAGNGAKSAGAYLGVAPRANLVDVKVTDDQGTGTTADVIAGIQWVYNNKNAYNIRVANLSLNSTVAESYHTSALDAALEILWFSGVTVVVSAGNNGTTASGVIYPPANDPFVITVGAADDKGTVSISDDVVPNFSAYGTTFDGFAKPDLVAPGRNIISLLSSDDSNLVVKHPANAVNGQNGSYYFRMSGTSMASAVVAGAVALLVQDEPNLTPDQIKYRLRATANKTWSGYNSQKAGAGYLDIYAAVNGTTTANSNTGLQASQLLWTGSNPITWGSVNWNSVNWNSVNWNSVNWNSVNWNSVNWNSVTWE